MKEIILPKSNSETGGNTKEDWEKIVIPESMSQTEELKLYPEILNKFGEKIKDTEADLVKVNEKIELYNEKIVDQSNKNIETIGVFSAILALLIIDVSIVKSATSFLSAILLIVCFIKIGSFLLAPSGPGVKYGQSVSTTNFFNGARFITSSILNLKIMPLMPK